jgi:hypothetical protein
MHLTTEQIGDLGTLGVLSVMWWFMTVAAWCNTREWDWLGRALTFLTFCLGVTTTISMAFVVLDPELWFVVVRWTFRAMLTAAGVGVLVTLRRANTKGANP